MAGKNCRPRQRRRVADTANNNDLIPPTAAGLSNLLQELHAIMDEHPELYLRLYDLIGWLLTPQGFVWNGWNKQQSKEWVRHLVVRHRLELGDKWEDAMLNARKELKHHPAFAAARTMRESYQDVERELPAELRRPRTYRPKKRK